MHTPGHNDPLVSIGDPREVLETQAYEEFARLAAQGEAVALVTVIGAEGSAPRGLGAAMAVRGDGTIVGTIGGGELEHRMISHALESLEDGRPRRYHYDFSGQQSQNLDKACLGQTEFFIQPSRLMERLHIFGAGHIGRILAGMARQAGFLVTLVDDRDDLGAESDLPPCNRALGVPFEESIESLSFDLRTYVVIVTYGHLQDEAVLRACLHRPGAYLGMIGSRAKVGRVFAAVAHDAPSRKALERVHAPIGLDLGGRSPGEIAVSILAELIAVRHGKQGADEMRRRQNPQD